MYVCPKIYRNNLVYCVFVPPILYPEETESFSGLFLLHPFSWQGFLRQQLRLSTQFGCDSLMSDPDKM